MRIEAWRLLARCRGAKGDKAAAFAALEKAVGESKEVRYTWMEKVSLQDMLPWVEGAAQAAVQGRLDMIGL